MSLTPIDDHVDAGLARLLQQQKGRPNLQALLAATLGQAQDLEDTYNKLFAGRLFANAAGAQLDGIGQIVGASRMGLGDAAYRLEIVAKIAADTGRGTVNDLIDVARALFDADEAQVMTVAPGYVQIDVGNPKADGALWPRARQILQRALAAGVALAGLGQYAAATGDTADMSFRLAGSEGGLGFSSVANPTSGGRLASAIG